MKQLHWIFLTLSIGCGGLQTTESDCEKGFDRADDGACYPSGGGGLSGGLDDDGDGDDGIDDDGDGDGGIDADGGDDGPADGSTGDDGAGDDGAGDGAPPDGGPPADEGPPDEGTDGGPMDEGPSDDGPSDDGGDVGEPFVDCESNADCTMDDCPDGSMGCECLIEAGFCVPTCDTDADCVEEGFVCEDIGICGPDE